MEDFKSEPEEFMSDKKNNTDTVRALISAMTDYIEQEIEPELDVIERWRDQLESALASAPPSAPVGVWTDEQCLQFADVAFRHSPKNLPDGVTLQDIRIAAASVFAIAQEPAAPSGEAVAWHTEDHLADKSATTYDPVVRNRWIAKGLPVTPIYAAPQQPAGVDEAMPVLTELVATLAATGTVTGGRIYFPERQTRELLKKACDALAAKQQVGAK